MSRIERILVPTDFSRPSTHAVAYAVGLARVHGSRVELLHSYGIPARAMGQYDSSLPGDVLATLRDAAARKLLKTFEKVKAEGVDVDMRVTDASPAEAIAASATRLSVQLIVMGTHGRSGLKHVLLGSVAERTVRLAPCPVMTVKEPPLEAEAGRFRKILVPTDFATEARAALELASDLAATSGPAEVIVGHAYCVPAEIEALVAAEGDPRVHAFTQTLLAEMERLIEPLTEDGVSASFRLRAGNPERVIVDTANEEGVDLIVMATHGRTGLSHVLLGSVAERVLRLARCPVITVSSRGHPTRAAGEPKGG
ncbi:MAG: universal stress protein [Deltaproteobacteria bacterium]|nr:MAG: universal stress protein [Deltaproteobacteria bacterium]